MKKLFIFIILILCLCTGFYIYQRSSKSTTLKETQEKTHNVQEYGDSEPYLSSWNDSHSSLSRHFDIAVVKDDIIYGAYLDGSILTAVAQDLQNGNILTETTVSNVSDIQNITVDSQKNIYITGLLNNKNCLWQIDVNGLITVWDNFELEDINYSQYPMSPQPKGIFVDDKGYFYFWYELDVPYKEFNEDADPDVYTPVDRIYVKDGQLNTIFYEQIPDSGDSKMLGFSLDKEGIPTILAQDATGVYMQQFNTENGNRINRKEIDGIQPYTLCENMVVKKEGFLFRQGNKIYQYLFENHSCEEMLDLTSYGIFASDIIFLKVDKETIEIIDNYKNEALSEYTILQPGENDKIQLILGTITMQQHSSLESIVTQFNRSQNDIRVELINYYNVNNNFDKEVEQLKLDITRGKVPDILEVSMIDWEMLAKKGLWADLYDFMEQDTECQKDMLIPNIVKAYELDGHLYNIAPSFHIHSMWGSKSIIENQYGVTFQELMKILQDNGKDLNAIYGFSADTPIQTTLCAMEMDEFINWKDGTCNFESDNFKLILKFAKEYNAGQPEGTLLERIHEGDIIISSGILYSVADYQMEKQFYGSDLSFIGYPVQNGTGTAVSFRGNQLAINSNGKNLDAAWEFVKYYLLNGYDDDGFPVLKEQFDAKMLSDMEKQYSASMDGIIENPRKTYFDGTNYLEVFEASYEDVEAIEELIKKIDCKFQYHPEIQNIINEEAEAYFTGQKSIGKVTELIQNRVSLYLQEQIN